MNPLLPAIIRSTMFNSMKEVKNTMAALTDSLHGKLDSIDTEVVSMVEALQQVFDIAEAVDQQNQILTSDEISDIGEQGLSLIDNLLYKLASQTSHPLSQDVKQLALIFVQWIIRHRGLLTNIQLVVDGLAYQANALQDHTALSQLAALMGQVANACSDVIKHDLDNSNPARPWRVLNLNRGIVATRSHDPDVMRAVFAELIHAIPMDAPEFFKEGMSEMVRLNYPQRVCELMQEYYEQTKLPVVH